MDYKAAEWRREKKEKKLGHGELVQPTDTLLPPALPLPHPISHSDACFGKAMGMPRFFRMPKQRLEDNGAHIRRHI